MAYYYFIYLHMLLHEVGPNKGARKSRIRRGRGDASGYGSFSGRGCKGQNARSGGGVKLGFEGGQTPLWKRMPKMKGFRNPNRVAFLAVNLLKIENNYENGETVSELTLFEKGIISSTNSPIKILGSGELTKKVTFENVAFSSGAKAKVEKSGSTILGGEAE